ncbi:MAG: transporter related protein [Actinomycetia bacterium]|nr:transporter related protein [Actinomycetes bacterium]
MATATDLHLLRCLPRPSPLHRLWAGTKLVIVAAVGTAVVAKPTWAAQGVAAAFLGIAMLAAHYPLGALPRLPKWFFYVLGFGAFLAFTAGGKPYVHVAGYNLGLNGIEEWARFTVLGVIVLGLAIVLGATTPVADLPGAVDRLCTPFRWLRLPVDEFVAAFTLVVRAFPLILDEIRTLFAAWRLRRPELPRDMGVLRELHDALVTAVAASMRRARDLARAIDARGGLGRMPPPPVRIRVADVVALLLAGATIVAIVRL